MKPTEPLDGRRILYAMLAIAALNLVFLAGADLPGNPALRCGMRPNNDG